MSLNTVSSVGSSLYVGTDGGMRYFDGCMDDVRIYDRALSTEEVAGLSQVASLLAGRVTAYETVNGYRTTVGYKYQESETAAAMAP